MYVQIGNSAHNGLLVTGVGTAIESWEGEDLHISWLGTELGIGMVVGSIVLLKLV